MTRPTPSRRGFLAVAGGAFLAGCGGLVDRSDGSDESIPVHRLPDVTDEGDAHPILVDSIPVDIEREQLRERLRRVATLLETVPVPLEPSAVPNGVIRRRLVEATDEAAGRVHDARTAQTRFSALNSLRRARERARYAAAGWAYVDRGRTSAELRAEQRRAVTDVRSLRAAHAYLGTDPVRATLVHARIERNLGLVFDDRTHVRESSPLVTVAEWGERAESTRALADDTRYLHDRYTDSLPADADTVEETLDRAVEDLTGALRARRDRLPPAPTERDDEFAWRLSHRLRDDATSSVRWLTATDGPARAVLAAVEGLTDFRAHERVRRQIEEGELTRARTAPDLRMVRDRATRAIRTALERSPRPELARPVLADAAAAVAYADEELARYRTDVRPAQLDDPVRRYTLATVRAQSVSAACRRVLDALAG